MYKGALLKREIVAVFIFAALAGVAPAMAAPITLDTALPVAEGEGIFRVQTIYTRSTDDPTSQDRELTVWAFPFVLGYGVTSELAVFGIVPVLDKELDFATPTGRVTRGDSGIGDSTFIVRYTAWKKDRPGETLRVAPFAGLKAPTGEDNKADSFGRLPQPLQLGSGSWDYFAGALMTWQTLKRQVDASLAYRHNTEANDFRFGDTTRLDVSYQHRLWPAELGTGVPAFVYGVLETNLIRQAKNKISGANDPDSGGTVVYLTPGIQYVTKRTVIEGAVQLPAVQDLNGDALENDFIALLSFRMNF